MPGYTLKVKTKRGQQLLDGLDADSTVGELKKRLNELTEIPETNLHILTGFPPKKLDISIPESTIKAVGVVNGDTLIVEEKAATSTSGNPNAAVRDQEAADQELAQSLAAAENCEFNGILMKKVVPADNSCLFTSIGYVLNGTVDTDIGAFMRQIIAQHVANDKATYTEAMLGRPNLEYCEWILRLDSWGGAIEVSILSSFYGMEICVVDIINAIIIRFGEDQNYGTRAFLLFDGIHYDPLYMESITGGAPKTIFPREATNMYQQAEQLAKEANASRQFTDVNKFTLRCMVCDSLLTGQVEAQQHAKSTGHANFGEV